MARRRMFWDRPDVHATLMPDVVEELRLDRRSWRVALLTQLHTMALLEAFERRAPRTAREYAERDWLAQEYDDALPEIAIAARLAHRATSPAPRKSRGRSTHSYYAAGAPPAVDPFA